MARIDQLKHQHRMLDAASDAMNALRIIPDVPADLSDVPVGAFPILRAMGVDIWISGDQAFALMRPESDSD